MKKLVSLIITLCILITTAYAYNVIKTVNGNQLITSVNAGKVITVQYIDVAGYTFNGWSVTGVTIANLASKEITFTMPSNDVTIEANFQKASYTITYNLYGGTATNPITYTSDDTITLTNPTKSGSTFLGWTGSNGETPEMTVTIEEGSIGNKTYNANWTATIVSYTVYHYLENAEDTGYTLNSSETQIGELGQSITLAELTSSLGNLVYADYSYGSTTNGGSSVTTATIQENGTIYLYYTRKAYALTLDKNEYVSSVSGAGTYKWGARVEIGATLGSTTGYDYSFNNWTSSNTSLVENQISQSATITMSKSAITLTANGERTIQTNLVIVTQQGGGTITPGTTLVNYGANQTFTITASSGYEIAQIKVNGVVQTITNSSTMSYTFCNVTAEQTLYVLFGVDKSTITIGSYITYVPESTSYTVATTASGYSIAQNFNPNLTTSWRIMYNNGGQLDIISTDSVGDLYLYGKTGYGRVVATLNALGNAYANTSTTAISGRHIGCTSESQDIIVESAINYDSGFDFPYIDDLYVKDVNQIANNNLGHSTGTTWLATRYRRSEIAGRPFKIQTLESNGTVTEYYGKSLYNEGAGKMVVFEEEGISGVRPVVSLLSDITINAGSGTVDDPYKIMLQEVDETTPQYTITVDQGTNGIISPATTKVLMGRNETFTITPAEGYVIEDVIVDGESVGNVSSYRFNRVITNHTITAIFRLPKAEEILVGSYVLYVPSTTSIKVYEADTGYTGEQSFNPSEITSWRVMYNNEGQLDILSTESVGNLILDGENGYRKAVDTLNTICNAYVNSNATSGRSIGCTNNSIGTVTETIEAGISGLPYVDSYDETDLEQLSEKALLENGSVWLASRSISTINANVICCIKVVEYNNTGYNYDRACIFGKVPDIDGITINCGSASNSNGVRPVVSLKAGVTITGGNGTAENPYILAW